MNGASLVTSTKAFIEPEFQAHFRATNHVYGVFILPASQNARWVKLFSRDETSYLAQLKSLIGFRYVAGSMFLSLRGYTMRRWRGVADPGISIGA